MMVFAHNWAPEGIQKSKISPKKSQLINKFNRWFPLDIVFFFFDFLPEMWMKQWVRTAIVSPDASDVDKRIDDMLAPVPTPAAAPQTINT